MYLENFILVDDDFYTPEDCNKMIEVFEKADKLGFTLTRKKSQNDNFHKRADNQLYTNDIISKDEIGIEHLSVFKDFNTKFWEKAYNAYSEKFSVLLDASRQTMRSIKIQKTNVGEGYHIWHFENMGKDSRDRVLTFILYLNDVADGGETEFLYYPKRINAQQGRLVLFPAALTHTHRGNPPISNTKYILTGWVEFD